KLPDGSPAASGCVARVDSDGLVSAESAGSFVVEAVDQIGRKDRTRSIVVLAGQSAAEVKRKADGAVVGMCGSVVSAVYDGFMYVQDAEKPSGIRVVTDVPAVEGDRVWLVGTLETADGERVIRASWLEVLL
ncbi:MAG: hypothetical protein QHI38_13145, partial [Armatimonadota bacterium]|nr:hypothetical protein [Armatimonadota bacterium]